MSIGSKITQLEEYNSLYKHDFCIYYKESLSVCALNLTNLNEFIICEVSIQNCKRYIGVIYRSLSQNTAEF